jgi:hypothetical protein
MPLKRIFFELGAVLVAGGLIALFTSRLLAAHGLLLVPDYQPIFGDFIAFWSAGRATLEGHVDSIHNRIFLQAYQHAAVPGMHNMAPWNSPPPFLLIAAPLAILPFPLAAIVFLIASGAIYLIAARKLLPDSRAMLFAVLLPAALYHLGTVQTGLYIAGISGLALYWLDKRPRAAGLLIALLIIKPHLAILWPIMLLLTKRWRTFAWATGGTLVLCVAAGLIFGFGAYPRFLESLRASADLVGRLQVPTQTYGSLFGNLLTLRVPLIFATIAQAISALTALAAACWIFRRGDWKLQGAALCAATLLLSPYLFFYDFTLLAVSLALLGAPRNRFEIVAMVLAWLSAISVSLGYIHIFGAPICPAAAWLVLIAALRRTGSAAAHLAPAPQM